MFSQHLYRFKNRSSTFSMTHPTLTLLTLFSLVEKPVGLFMGGT